MKPLRTSSCLLVLLLLAAPLAHAGDERPIDVPLANGKTLHGVVKEVTATEVALALAGGKTRRVPFAQLTPLAVYRVKASIAPVADGDERKKLALLAADLGLYVEARVEYEKALALGALTKREFTHLVAKAERQAVEAGVNRARKLAESGDLESALDIATNLRMHFAGAANAKQVGRVIRELLALVDRLDKEAIQAGRELEQALVDLKKNKEIIRRKAEAQARISKGVARSKAAGKAREKGQVSRARKSAEAADAEFNKARRNFGRLRRILPRGSELRRGVLAKLVELDKLQFDLLFQMAFFMYDQRIWSQAERFTARASYIDPVHPQLMELRDELVSSRIRYRLSDMTNARPIIR